MVDPNYTLIDITRDVSDPNYAVRPLWETSVVAVHRIFFDDWDLAELTGKNADKLPLEICRRFINDPEIAKYTGGELAYTILVNVDGGVWQVLPLDEQGAHARVWNDDALAVGVIGDPRVMAPPKAQYHSLCDVTADLCQSLAISPGVRSVVDGVSVYGLSGHDELPNGSKDAGKACPGALLPMSKLRQDVAYVMADRARVRLLRAGAVISRL